MKPVKYFNEQVGSKQLALKIAEIADNKKGFDIKIMDMREVSSLTDYFIVISGLNAKHGKALAGAIELNLKKEFNIFCRHVDGIHDCEWIVLDYIDIIVHIFQPEKRGYYGLEKLWADSSVLKLP